MIIARCLFEVLSRSRPLLLNLVAVLVHIARSGGSLQDCGKRLRVPLPCPPLDAPLTPMERAADIS